MLNRNPLRHVHVAVACVFLPLSLMAQTPRESDTVNAPPDVDISAFVPIASNDSTEGRSAVEGAGGVNINAGFNDSWFNQATAGQGFFITYFPDGASLFLAWFTYDTQRPDPSVTANLGEPGHRWLTAFGDVVGNSAMLEVELTEGGVFDSADPAPTQSADGTILLECSTCNSCMVTYDITSAGVQGVIPIERIAGDNIPTCEALAQ
ncbi:MAG: hypothetical protein R3212_01150 [Xanthomonadales bacterium]|nr:hypothetical protein [Xanthomonadales bacterium]